MSSDSQLDRRSFLQAAGGAAASAALVSTASADASAAQQGGTLVYARGDHPENYDPQQTTSGEVAKVTNQIFDTLIAFEPGTGGELTDGLASDWSLEETTATLTLKEGIQFHSGEEFTASDFQATVRRFTDPEYDYYLGDANRSGYASQTFGDWIDSIDASQDYQLTIELTQQYAPFLRNLAMFAASVLSEAQITALDASPEAQVGLGLEPVGTGPFAFDQLDNPNERILLTANEDFWGDGPNVDQVVFKTITENSTRIQDVINGNSHVTDNLDADGFQRAQQSQTATLLRKNGLNVGYMAFNFERMEPFRDQRVRQAVSYAVNTEAIVNQIYQGFATQADQPLPPDILGHNDDLEPYQNDKEQAQSLLEEAGYGDGFEFELATFSNPRGYNPSPVQTANQVRSDLQGIGLTVSINQFSSFTPYIEYTAQGRHDACFLGWYTDNADPDNFMAFLLDPGVPTEDVPDGQDWVSFDADGYNTLNVAGWANTEFMNTIRDAASTYDEEQRRTLYEEASQLAHDEAPWVYLDYAETLRAIHQSVVEDSYVITSINNPVLETVQLQQ